MDEKTKIAFELLEWIEKYSFDFGAQTRAHYAIEHLREKGVFPAQEKEEK